MNAKSHGLEIVCELLEEEAEVLENYDVKGTLKYREDTIQKDIPMILRKDPNLQDSIKVSQDPDDCFLGNASLIEFTVNEQFYQTLVQSRYSVERFYGAKGKLEVKIPTSH